MTAVPIFFAASAILLVLGAPVAAAIWAAGGLIVWAVEASR